jgi:hypothetical protein
MVAYESWTSTNNVYIDVAGERERHDDDPFLSMIEDDLHPLDKILTWDPGIPAKVLNHRVVTSAWMFEAASQFSNTGALPIVEYFIRNRIYPVAHRYPKRLRMRYGPVEKEVSVFSPRGSRRHRESCVRAESSDDDEGSSGTDSDEEEVSVLIGKAEEDLYSLVKRPIKKPTKEYLEESERLIQDTIKKTDERRVEGQLDLEGLSEGEALDKMLENIDNKDWHNVVENPDERNDIFDNSDEEDLGLDLSTWL